MAMVVVAVALAGAAGAIISSMALNRVNRDTALAQQAARRLIEEVTSVPFAERFACYNDDTSDDAGLSIAARGANFTVLGLDARADDLDGACGRIEFPVGAPAELREDIVDLRLGMPRDLNGDGVVDAANHCADYVLLPVRVVVEWRSVSGARRLAVESILSTR